MYFPDTGCVHTLLTLYVYATACTGPTKPRVSVTHEKLVSKTEIASTSC